MASSSPADPRISVVIPARNEERYVRAALASVAAQDWPAERLESIVVDNGSTDRTSDVVTAFAAEERRLPVRLLHEPIVGVSRAKNRGAAVARGDVLVFLDADSRLAPDVCARVAARVAEGCRACSIRVVADSRDPLDRAFFELIEWGKSLFEIRAQMFYCAADLFRSLGGFDEGLRHAEDREFLDRAQRAGLRVCHISESEIATSPRRLHAHPFRLGMVTTFARMTLGNFGIGRRWSY